MKAYVVQAINTKKVYVVVANRFLQVLVKLSFKHSEINVLYSGNLQDAKLVYPYHDNEVIA